MNRIAIIILIFLGTGSCDTFDKGRIFPDITGAWSCQENSAYSGYRKYLIEIDKKASSDNLYIISNFHNQGDLEFIYFYMEGDSIFIENEGASGIIFNGKGKVNAEFNELEIRYESDDGSIRLQYLASCSR